MAQATYNSEDFSVTFEANRVLNDYGVKGSPTWYELEDVTITAFVFLGLNMPLEHIPDNVYDALCEYANEIDGGDWE